MFRADPCENPYGIVACDYGPTALDTAITFATLSLALTFTQLVYLPGNRSFFEQEGYWPLTHAARYLLLLAAGAGVTPWLAAMLTLRWFPRG